MVLQTFNSCPKGAKGFLSQLLAKALTLNSEMCLSVRRRTLAAAKMGPFGFRCFFDLGFGARFGCVCIRLGASGKGSERRSFLVALTNNQQHSVKELLSTISICFPISLVRKFRYAINFEWWLLCFQPLHEIFSIK
jgi:hypothetical protein